MIIVMYGVCDPCKEYAEEHPEYSKIRLPKKCLEWHNKEKKIKFALSRLGHDGNFPCLLTDDLSVLVQKDDLEAFDKDPKKFLEEVKDAGTRAEPESEPESE